MLTCANANLMHYVNTRKYIYYQLTLLYLHIKTIKVVWVGVNMKSQEKVK